MSWFRKHLFQHGKTICLLSTTTLIHTPPPKNENNVIIVSKDDKKPLDGWDRLALMYSRNEFGELSNELAAVTNAGTILFLMSTTYGVTKYTKEAYTNFVENNQASKFASMFEAKKKLQDRVMMAAFKGMFEYGIKLTAFSTFMLFGITSMMVYSGHSSVFHYGLAGLVFGGVYKWKLGPRGMLVGGTVGGLLGLLAGASTNGLLYMFDSSLDDIITANAENYKRKQRSDTDSKDRMIREDAAPDALQMIEERDILKQTLPQTDEESGSSEK